MIELSSTVELVDRPEDLIKKYVTSEINELHKQWANYDQKPQMEKPSALFVTSTRATYVGMTDPDPLYGEAITVLEPTFRPEIDKLVLKQFERFKLPTAEYARGGAAFHSGFRNKRLVRWNNSPRELMQALDFWRDPDWHEIAGKKCCDMIQDTEMRLQQNLMMLVNTTNREERIALAVADRERSTGTGWESEPLPLNDREHFGLNCPYVQSYLEFAIHEWCLDVQIAYEQTPEKGVIIRAPTKFKGTRKASRSDPSCAEWSNAKVTMHAGVREVNTTPTSALSNHSLTPSDWNRSMWLKYQPPGWISPYDPRAYVESLLTLPATTQRNAPIQAINLDFGWTNAPPKVSFDEHTLTNKWEYGKETVKFGADNIVTAGVMMQAKGIYYPAKWSGDMNTMRAYLTEVGWLIYTKLKRAGITIISVTQVGDDISIRVRREDVPAAMAVLGPWARTKGMHDEWQFVLGTYVGHVSEDKVVALIGPRVLKSVTSPSMLTELPRMTIGEVYTIDVPIEAQQQAEVFLKTHPQAVFFEGTEKEYATYITTRYLQDKIELAEVGGVSSEWVKDLFPTETSLYARG